MKIKKGMQLLKTIVELRGYDDDVSYDGNSDDGTHDLNESCSGKGNCNSRENLLHGNEDRSDNDNAALISNATTELYSIFNAFARVSFPLDTISCKIRFDFSDKIHPIVGSHSDLIKVLKPDTEEYYPSIERGPERSDNKTFFMMRYVENVAICDALPTLEETFYISGANILEKNDKLYQERYTSELNWSKSSIRFELTVVGRKERIADEKYPELHLDSKNYQVYW
jgi:hypothetical protein